MAVDDDFVIVQKSLFDCLRQHAERCPDFSEQLQDLSDGRVIVVPHRRPPGERSLKRKTLHGLGPQEVLQPSLSSEQPKTQLSSQPSKEPGLQLPCKSSSTSQRKKPEGARSEGPRKRPQPRQKPRKNKAVDWFLRNAPKATEWRKRQTELDLNTVEQYQEVIRAFTDHTNVIVKRKPYLRDGYSKHVLVDLAERFALLIRDSLTNAKLQRSFATFQALILLSFCEVLRKRGIPYQIVDQIITHITSQEYDRRKLLNSALWINSVIVDLIGHGWTIYRATELFFIGVFSKLPFCKAELMSFSDALFLTYLTHIHNDENSQSILNHLRTDEFVKHDYSDCLRPEYTIPGLIASLLDTCNTTANKLSYGFPVRSQRHC